VTEFQSGRSYSPATKWVVGITAVVVGLAAIGIGAAAFMILNRPPVLVRAFELQAETRTVTTKQVIRADDQVIQESTSRVQTDPLAVETTVQQQTQFGPVEARSRIIGDEVFTSIDGGDWMVSPLSDVEDQLGLNLPAGKQVFDEDLVSAQSELFQDQGYDEEFRATRYDARIGLEEALRVASASGIAQDQLTEQSRELFDDQVEMTFWVNGDDRIVRSVTVLSVQPDADSPAAGKTITTELDFSEWDAPLQVERPDVDGSSGGRGSVSACETEAATLRTARAAAQASGGGSTPEDFLQGPLTYFELDGSRSASTTDEVSEADCPPVGS
jgi:hypothetical protein